VLEFLLFLNKEGSLSARFKRADKLQPSFIFGPFLVWSGVLLSLSLLLVSISFILGSWLVRQKLWV